METRERPPPNKPVAESSDRVFGIFFAVVFILAGLFPLLGGGRPTGWTFVVAGAVLAAALFKPGWLAPFNRA